MADFDITKYLSQKSGGMSPKSPTPELLLEKMHAVSQATQQKQLDALRGSITAGFNEQTQNADSWASQLGLDPRHDALGLGVNLAAQVADGSTRVAKNFMAGLHDLNTAAIDQHIPDEAKTAYARYKSGSASQADIDLLGLDAGLTAKPTYQSPMRRYATSVETNLQRLQRMEESIARAEGIRGAVDVSKVVHSGNTEDLQGALRVGYREAASDLESGWEGVSSGDFTKLPELGKGMAIALLNAGVAAVDNPKGVLEYVANNVPQLAAAASGSGAGMALTNIPYAVDAFGQGITEYRKKHGELPPKAEMQRMATYAASLALAESAGDALTLGAGRMAKMVGKGTVEVATREGLKASLAGVTKATATGALGETLTEGYQTAVEESIKGNTASAEDIYVGAAIGGLTGAALSGGIHTVDEASRGTAKAVDKIATKAKERVQQKEELDEAIANNDPTPFLDRESPTYAPDKAIQVLHSASQQEDVTEEQKDANLKQATEVVAGLESERDALVDQAQWNDPAYLQTVRDQMATELEQADASRQEELRGSIAAFDEAIAEAQGEQAQASLKQERAKIEALDRHLESSRRLLDTMRREFAAKGEDIDVQAEATTASAAVAPDDTASVSKAQDAADRVINLSMRAPEQVDATTARSMATSQGSALSDKQRAYLERYADAQDAEATLLSLSSVHQRVMYGGGSDVGIAQYKERFKGAYDVGNASYAASQLKGIEAFAQRHGSKMRAIDEAVAKSGKGAQILPDGAGGWKVADRAYNRSEIAKLKGMTINSGDLVRSIRAEAKALETAAAQLRAAYELKFTQSGSVDSTQAQAAVAAPSLKSTEEAQTHSKGAQSTNTEQKVNSTKQIEPVQAQEAPVTAPQSDTAALIKEGVDPVEDVVEHQSSEVQESSPELNVYAQRSDSTVPFQQRNLVADFTRQVAGREGDVTARPLVKVKDFLSRWIADPTFIKPFLGEKYAELSDSQQVVLEAFTKAAKAWQPMFHKNLARKAQREFWFKDLMQFMLVEEGGNLSLEENVSTAMAYAAFSGLTELVAKGSYNSHEDINKILGRDDETLVSEAEEKALAHVGMRINLVNNMLGKRAVQAMGLVASPDAPRDILPRLESAIGRHIVQMLLDQGALAQESISGEVMAALRGSKEAGKEEHLFIKVARNAEGKPHALVQRVSELSRGTGGVLDALFSVEPGIKMPSFEPVPFLQKTTKNTRQGIPEVLRKVMEEKNAEANYLKLDMLGLFNVLDRGALLSIAGHKPIDMRRTHVSREKGLIAKNESLERELDRFFEFVDGMPSEDAAFYFEHSVWKQQRVGIATNGINPQTSKLHRHLMFRKAWESTIDPGNTKQMDNFRLRVLEGLGVKTDKQANEKSLSSFEDKISGGSIKAAVDALTQTVMEGAQMTDAHQKAIVEGVKAGGENMHTLDALMALARYRHAAGRPFTVQMMGEIDGVTNGPMLSHLALGAAQSVEELFDLLNRGGFYEQGNDYSDYNLWRSATGRADLYESTTIAMLDKLQQLVEEGPDWMATKAAAIEAITGKLLDSEKGVTKDGRNIIKTPLTAMVFGSSTSNAADGMADNFIETIYDRFEALADKPNERQALVKNINVLLYGAPQIHGNATPTDLLAYTFTQAQIDTIKKSFSQTFGKAVKRTMEDRFGAFIDTRRSLNEAATLAFEIYNAAATTMREEFIQELIAREKEAPGTGLAHGKADNAYHTLSDAQEAEFRKRLNKLNPVVHTAMSRKSGTLAAGLRMAKSKNALSDNPLFRSEVLLAANNKNGFVRASTNANEVQEKSPGVAMVVMLTHAIDSAISHLAAAGQEVLNIHDAHGSGLQDFTQTARNLNKATWDVLLDASPAMEIHIALNRTLAGLGDLLAQPDASDAVKASIAQAISRQAAKSEQAPAEFLQNFPQLVAVTAYTSDGMKLEAMSQMKAVNQYALEGGAYEVTDDDRAQAKAKRDALRSGVTQAQVDNLQRISETLAPFFQKAAESTPTEGDMKYKEQLEHTRAVHVLPVLDRFLVDPDLSGIPAKVSRAREQAQEVRDAIVRDKVSVGEALDTFNRTYDSPSYLAGAISKGLDKTSSQNRWGELGTPTIDSDMDLVNLFEKEGTLNLYQALTVLQRKLGKGPNKRLNEFNLRLLHLISKTANKDLVVRYVTPTTPASAVLERGADRSRGWYVSKGGKDAVYVLSPDFQYSGLTAETLLHELVHAALAHVINSPTVDAQALVAELEALRVKALNHIQTHSLSEYADAVVNVQELVAWGMSNLGFQKDVLNQISMPSTTHDNVLVRGMRKFIDIINDLLFGQTDQRTKKLNSNGMALLINNVSGLFNAAAQSKSRAELNLSHKGPDVIQEVKDWHVGMLFDALDAGDVRPDTLERIRDTLTDITHKLGIRSLKVAIDKNTGLSAADLFQKAKDEGYTPFASSVMAGPFKTPDAVALAVDQVEATVRAALETNETHTTMAYNELRRLYEEVRRTLSAKDFLEDPDTATQDELDLAQEQYDFLFAVEQGSDGKSNYLARFAAMGLAHPQVMDLLGVETSRRIRPLKDGKSFAERLHILFDNILAFFQGKVTHTRDGMQVDVKLKTLTHQLVDIEARRRRTQAASRLKVVDSVENTVRDTVQNLRNKVGDMASSPTLREHSNVYVRALSGTVSVLANDRVDLVLNGLTALRTQYLKDKQSMLLDAANGVVEELRGLAPKFSKMLRQVKHTERERKRIITQTANLLVDGFADPHALKQAGSKARVAITEVFLRTDMASLLDHYDMERVHGLLTRRTDLHNEIASLENQLSQFSAYKDFYIKSSKLLGYFMATGKVKGDHLLMNARNIAALVGTSNQGQVSAGNIVQAEQLIDRLVTLYALQYTNSGHKQSAAQILSGELARTDGGNGVSQVLMLHRSLKKQAMDRLFKGSEALFIKGYLPEIHNPHTEVKVANLDDGARLIDQGYVRGHSLSVDPADPDSAVRHIYVLRDGGLSPYLSGLFSLTSEKTKGHQMHSGLGNAAAVLLQAQVSAAKQPGIASMFQPDPGFDPSRVKPTFMAPVVNGSGDVVNYRYMMHNALRDTVLERDNRFDKVLGTLAGNLFDKEEAPRQNKEVVSMLRDLYLKEYTNNPKAFISVGLHSTDPALRDAYRMLPEKTRDEVRRQWGRDEMLVRADLLDVTFGYRKLTISSLFEKEQSQLSGGEYAVVRFVEHVLMAYATGVNTYNEMRNKPGRLDPKTYARRAALVVRKNERVWQEIVAEIKDIIVVKTGVVLLGNILSNTSLLAMNKVPLNAMVRHHRVALRGTMDYKRDMEQLFRLRSQLEAGYLEDEEVAVRGEIAKLEDAIARNPVKPLIDAGLMPTIVEDIQIDDDLYSYKSKFVRDTESFQSKLNPGLVKAGKLVYMAHDTKMYRSLSQLTQMSDFVARYTLYHHLMERSDTPLNAEEAAQEASDAFVNYDIPMQRGIQYLDDMGITMFTKYFLRIQRVLFKLVRENPTRVLGLVLLNNLYDLMPMVTDSSMWARIGNNPLYSGAFQLPSTLDELATVGIGLSLFK